MKPREWTEAEKEFLRTQAEIARQLGRKPPMVWSKAYSMGLRLKPDQRRRDDLVDLLGRVVDQMLWEEPTDETTPSIDAPAEAAR